MTRSRTPRDLRERMERVAAKSRRPTESAPRRRARQPEEPERTDVDVATAPQADVTPPPPADNARERQRTAAPARPSSADRARQGAIRAPDVLGTEPQSRLETLLAWGRWELTVVPAQRWKWFKSAMRTGDTEGTDRKRRH